MEGGGFIVEDETPRGNPIGGAARPASQRPRQAVSRPPTEAATHPRTAGDNPPSGDVTGCESCGGGTFSQEWFQAFGVIMCNQCKREEKLITKTTAKEVYLLSDKDLQSLGSISKINPQHKQWTAMKLFLESQVQQLAVRKHGDMAQLDEERHKRIQAKLARRAQHKKEEQAEERREELQQQRMAQLMEEHTQQQQLQCALRKVSVLDEETGQYQEVYAVGETQVDVEEL